jgi:hypothetical protein
MSLNPATGLVYIPTTPAGNTTLAIDPDFTFINGRSNSGVVHAPRPGGVNTVDGPVRYASASTKILPAPPAIGPEPIEGQRGILLAWDPVNQKERWRANGGGGSGGGTVSTGGNLVFQVINDGRLLAYSADTGQKLLDVQTGLKGGMGPPITYMLDGKQYVSLMGGTGRIVPRNEAPAAPGAVLPPSPKLLTFVLDGKGTLPVGGQ